MLGKGNDSPSRGSVPHSNETEGGRHDDRGRWDHHLGRRYITGPNHGPGRGLGDGGERLHYWVFGGPWSYDQDPRGEATGADKELLDEASGRMGAVVGGQTRTKLPRRGVATIRSASPSSSSPHRPDDPHPKDDFTFVNGLDEAIARAREAAGGKYVSVMGGADVIRQALRAGHIEELTISIEPVVLGGGERLFEGFVQTISLEQERVRHSTLATHITYRVGR